MGEFSGMNRLGVRLIVGVALVAVTLIGGLIWIGVRLGWLS